MTEKDVQNADVLHLFINDATEHGTPLFTSAWYCVKKMPFRQKQNCFKNSGNQCALNDSEPAGASIAGASIAGMEWLVLKIKLYVYLLFKYSMLTDLEIDLDIQGQKPQMKKNRKHLGP